MANFDQSVFFDQIMRWSNAGYPENDPFFEIFWELRKRVTNQKWPISTNRSFLANLNNEVVKCRISRKWSIFRNFSKFFEFYLIAFSRDWPMSPSKAQITKLNLMFNPIFRSIYRSITDRKLQIFFRKFLISQNLRFF